MQGCPDNVTWHPPLLQSALLRAATRIQEHTSNPVSSVALPYTRGPCGYAVQTAGEEGRTAEAEAAPRRCMRLVVCVQD